MSEIIVIPARVGADGRAVHYFAPGSHLPLCDRLKDHRKEIVPSDDEVTCGACRTKFKRGGYALPIEETPGEEETPAGIAPDGLGASADPHWGGPCDDPGCSCASLEGAEEDAADEDEEDEKSTSKAMKFAAYAKGYGWATRIKVGPGVNTADMLTHIYAERGDVKIHMAWGEGRYHYNESRIIKGKGELLNQFIRNASAARGYVFAIHLNEDATRPVLRSVKTG